MNERLTTKVQHAVFITLSDLLPSHSETREEVIEVINCSCFSFGSNNRTFADPKELCAVIEVPDYTDMIEKKQLQQMIDDLKEMVKEKKTTGQVVYVDLEN